MWFAPIFSHIPYGLLVNWLYFLLLLFLTVKILLDQRNPHYTLSMLLMIHFIPVFGVIYYLLSGMHWKKRRIVRYIPELQFKEYLSPYLLHQNKFLEKFTHERDNDTVKAIRMLLNGNSSLLSFNNDCTIFQEGSTLFHALKEDLRRAEHSIHMEYFIWRSDELGSEIGEILLERAAAGVRIRLLFDGVGCFFRISRKYRRQLRAAGIEYRYFLDPLNPLFGWLLNYRNHRKLALIDGHIGYTGGMNVGSEYITGGRRFPAWRDTHMRITGDSVNLLQGIFISDWANSGGEQLEGSEYYTVSPASGKLPMQVVCSGPDSDWYSIKNLFFTLISNANREVLIQSPYFIPDDALEHALITAALSGVKVKLMMTGLPDKRVPFWVAHTYFEPLLEAGVEIYLYREAFLHSKVVVIDGQICSSGSCNMDIRSFEIHYEINLVFYDNKISQEFQRQFYDDIGSCVRYTREDNDKLKTWQKLRDSFLRLFAPLL